MLITLNKSSSTHSAIVDEEHVYLFDETSIRKKLNLLLSSLIFVSDNKDIEDIVDYWILRLPKFNTRLQAGYNCGLVALRIAIEYIINDTIDQEFSASLLKYSIDKGYSNEGELFSSYYLQDICNHFFSNDKYNINAIVYESPSLLDIMNHLSIGLPILVPYDADKNWRPINEKGKRAHWATIMGFIIPQINNNNIIKLINNNDDDDKDILFKLNNKDIIVQDSLKTLYINNKYSNQQPSIQFFNNNNNSNNTDNSFKLIDNNIYLICQHGKSKFIQLWEYTSLKSSNQCLSEPDKERLLSSRWKIPDNLRDLQNKWIFLNNNKNK
ncbi:hypothetical protein CYY_003526 [Polysphondylium violaceum]|uniref:Actin maturation protease n=1 Tax=Polysphondylium violaceum TaxID=133409 RepID=A0A8J4V123_9MYCE|nr:hypothetical protein CYY_003526 [Polysphondylium violaceum]